MTNLKKTALAILALGVSGLASAGMYVPPPADTAPEPMMKNGFYAGIGLGAIGYKSTVAEQGSAAGVIDDAIFVTGDGAASASQTGGNIGLNSELFVGYAWHLPKNMFLGTEIFGNLMNTPVNANVDAGAGTTVLGATATATANTDLTLQSAYGIRALPGYQVTNNAVVYGIAGWVGSRVKGSTYGSTTFGADGSSDTLSGSSEETYNYYGYQLGLGSMINVTEHILVRGDMIYSGYGKHNIASGSTTATTDGATATAQGSVSADPSSLEADVSLVYMFD